ncbi:MAG: fimbrillin family protein [Prevotella sp.]|nr:fimbrillin family protein [Prevotella sp.]
MTTQNAPRQMTFTAGYNEGAQTRATLNGSTKKVSFDANDKISILSAKNTNTQFTTSAGGASADFTGTATDDSKFYAVYPYTDGLTLSGDVISGVVIPTYQWNSGWNSKSNYSGWDPKAPIAYATTTGSSLQFHNLCAILKVTITGNETWAIFTISASEPLAGTFSLDTSNGTLTPTSGSTTVSVGNGSIQGHVIKTDGGNKTAYIAIAPGTYTDFTLYLENEDKDNKSNTKSSVTFEAGKIYDLGSYDVDYLGYF